MSSSQPFLSVQCRTGVTLKEYKVVKRFICLIYILVLPLLLVPTRGDATHTPYRILVLHSYSMDYQWTEGLHQGIKVALEEHSPSPHFRVEFMDTKNFFNSSYLDTLSRIYIDKYSKVHLDGIIVTDNNALEFMTSYGREIFPEVPVVACGINNATPPSKASYVKSIIAEESDHVGTIKQAMKFWPAVETLYILYDTTPTGGHIAREVERSLSNIEVPIKVEFIANKNLAELKQFVSTRKAQDLVYLLPFFRDADGVVFTQGQVARELTTVSTVPILATWFFQIGTGVIGGRVISPQRLGGLATRTLLQALKGQSVEPFQTSFSSLESLYDYNVVKQYRIDEKLLPKDVRFINKPKSFFQRHRDVLLPAGTLIAILSAIMVLLFLNLQKQRTINTANRRLLTMDKDIIETQRELVSTLGEVIEVRSKETGNHVKRVAKLSRLLGEKIGLTEHDLDMLEAASPMHDVGKIGVPESILHKLDELTDEEFDIVKTHTNIGNDLLGSSDRELLRTAGTIAYQHHERWDGTGYPNGLKGEEINLLARITMLADIYDALSFDRTYKKAWSEERILKYIVSERGRYFDPYLVDVFLENLNEVRAIRLRYSSVETKDDLDY